ncbi:MAG: tubulin/FtsZ family protein [Methanomicrobiales archaeon]|nr:tubulin/FtsZ family protein [Methanomicrobiales archaeon]
MRVLAIGLGGAGSRIVDEIYGQDRRGGIGCMSALAVDFDAATLLHLKYLPRNARIHFPPIDPTSPYDISTTIDIEEVMTQVQQVDTIEIDAIMIFTGLGGTMVDVAPRIIPELRKSFIEPIFAVAVLPCMGEGKKRSAKAAIDLETLQPLVDALILFDNDTWYKKYRGETSEETVKEKKEEDRVRRIARRITTQTFTTRDRVYGWLNDRLSRQIGLLLRAGEFSEKGVEVAEVVLDAGEVLNTLVGMGMVAVGYAAEHIPHSMLGFFDRWRSTGYFIESSQTKASRIVTLAKRAVYDEISIPCDLTSADKALVLIAGPSQELSMRGFQTVRKWIDRSIAGLEMRSGDYPVKNTRYVGIIILLSGMKNIPRIDELWQVQEEYRAEQEHAKIREEQELKAPEVLPGPAGTPAGSIAGEPAGAAALRPDRVLTLPGGPRREKRQGRSIPLFDGLTISMGKDIPVRYGPGETPPRGDGSPEDLSRKATVRQPMAPRDSVFGLKDVKMDRPAAESGEGGSGGKAREGIPAPRETVAGGELKRMKGIPRANDSSFTGREIQVKARDGVPDDSALMSPERGIPGISRGMEGTTAGGSPPEEESPQKPPGRGKKRRKGDEAGGDDESINWIH